MSGLYDPTTAAEGRQAFRAFRMHSGVGEEYQRLSKAVQAAVKRVLTPYRIACDGGEERGAWDETTAQWIARRFGGKVVRTPADEGRSMIEHGETIADVVGTWTTEDSEGRWLNIRAVTAGGTTKVYKIREDDARWLGVCMVDTMRPWGSDTAE